MKLIVFIIIINHKPWTGFLNTNNMILKFRSVFEFGVLDGSTVTMLNLQQKILVEGSQKDSQGNHLKIYTDKVFIHESIMKTLYNRVAMDDGDHIFVAFSGYTHSIDITNYCLDVSHPKIQTWPARNRGSTIRTGKIWIVKTPFANRGKGS